MCPQDTFIVGLNYFQNGGFAIKCKSLNSNQISTVNPKNYNDQQISLTQGWVQGYKYMTQLYGTKTSLNTDKVYIAVKFSDYDVNTYGYSNISLDLGVLGLKVRMLSLATMPVVWL
jgi:hypothetical protein